MGDPAAASLCPECGRPDPGPILPAPVRRRGPLIFLAAALLTVIITVSLIARHRTSGTITHGGFFPVLVEPAFTRAQIRAIAERGADAVHPPGALIAALQKPTAPHDRSQPGRRSLDVKFTTSEAPRSDSVQWGWPWPVIIRRTQPYYASAINRAGFKSAVTDATLPPLKRYEFPNDLRRIPPRPLWAWSGDSLLYQPPPERTGGVYMTVSIHPAAVAMHLGLLITAALMLSLAAVLLRRILRRDVLPSRRRAVVIALLTLGLVLAGLLSRRETSYHLYSFGGKSQQVGPPGPIFHIDPDMGRLPHSFDELLRWPRTSDSDRKVANEILAVTRHAPGRDSDYLFAGSARETVYDRNTTTTISPGVPLLLITQTHYTRRSDFGVPEHVLPDRRIALTSFSGFLTLSLAPRDPQLPVRKYSLNIELAA